MGFSTHGSAIQISARRVGPLCYDSGTLTACTGWLMASSSDKTRLEAREIEEISLAFEKLNPLLIVCDDGLRVVRLSRACNELIDAASEWIGRDLEEFLGCLCEQPDLRRIKGWCAELEDALASNTKSLAFRLGQGEIRGQLFGLDLAPLRDHQEGPERAAVLVVRPDDSEQSSNSMSSWGKSALNAILETSPDPIVAIDAQGSVTYANGPATRLFAPEGRSLEGLNSEAFHPYSPDLAEAVASLSQGDDTCQREIQIDQPGAEPLRLALSAQSVSARSVDTRADIATGHLIWLRNISDGEAHHLNLQRRIEELEEFIHGASHNLRSSLLPVLGFTQLLRDDFDHQLDDTGRRYTDRIETAARKMDALISDLLDLSRIFVGNIQRHQVDSRALLSRLESDLKRKLDEAAVELETPEVCPALSGDANYLYQMFFQLIVNAVEHMGECENRRIEISFSKQAQSNADLVSVRDYGQGIPPEELNKVFEAFHSREASPDGGKSRGLGLTFVRAIAEAHGGHAWAENPVQYGALFRVILPSG